MKNKINNLTEDIQTFNGNDTNLNIYFKKRFGPFNAIYRNSIQLNLEKL